MWGGRKLRDTFHSYKIETASYSEPEVGTDDQKHNFGKSDRYYNDDVYPGPQIRMSKRSEFGAFGKFSKTFNDGSNARMYGASKNPSPFGESGIYDSTDGGMFRLNDRRTLSDKDDESDNDSHTYRRSRTPQTKNGIGKSQNGIDYDFRRSRKENNGDFKNKFGRSRKTESKAVDNYHGYRNDGYKTDQSIETKMGWRTMALRGDVEHKWNKMAIRLNYNPRGGNDSLFYHHDDRRPSHYTQRKLFQRKTILLFGFALATLVIVAVPVTIILMLKSDEIKSTVAPTAEANNAAELEIEMKLNGSFTNELADKKSTFYQNFTRDFCQEIEYTMSSENSTYNSSDVTCTVKDVRNGSIIVIFVVRIYFISPVGQITKQTFADILTVYTSGRIRKYSVIGIDVVNIKYITTTKAADNTTVAITTTTPSTTTTQSSITTPSTTTTQPTSTTPSTITTPSTTTTQLTTTILSTAMPQPTTTSQSTTTTQATTTTPSTTTKQPTNTTPSTTTTLSTTMTQPTTTTPSTTTTHPTTTTPSTTTKQPTTTTPSTTTTLSTTMTEPTTTTPSTTTTQPTTTTPSTTTTQLTTTTQPTTTTPHSTTTPSTTTKQPTTTTPSTTITQPTTTTPSTTTTQPTTTTPFTTTTPSTTTKQPTTPTPSTITTPSTAMTQPTTMTPSTTTKQPTTTTPSTTTTLSTTMTQPTTTTPFTTTQPTTTTPSTTTNQPTTTTPSTTTTLSTTMTQPTTTTPYTTTTQPTTTTPHTTTTPSTTTKQPTTTTPSTITTQPATMTPSSTTTPHTTTTPTATTTQPATTTPSTITTQTVPITTATIPMTKSTTPVTTTTANTITSPMTTTSTTVVTTVVRFLASSLTFNISSSSHSIKCLVDGTADWISIEIWRTKGSVDTLLLRKYKNGVPPDQESLKARANYVYQISNSSLNATIHFSAVECEEEGTYRCVVNTSMSSEQATSTITVQRMPGNATLMLNPDQIIDMGFHRASREHSCVGEVGYPPGKLSVVYKQNGQSDFSDFPETKVIYYPESIEGKCSRVDTLRFGLNFTTSDDGAKIKCVIVNEKLGVTAESAPNSLELVPRNYCKDAMSTFVHHPSNCNKYVDCDNKEYPAVARCGTGECTEITATTVQCRNCDSVTCPTPPTTATATTTTTPAPGSLYIVTSDKSTLEGEPIVLWFNVSENTFDYINITRTPSLTGIEMSLANIQQDQSIAIINQVSGLSITFEKSLVAVKIIIAGMSCSDDGIYKATVKRSNESFSSSADVTLKVKPEKPTLTLHPDIVENFPRLEADHVCTGKVGYPGGKLVIEIQRNGTNYTVPAYLGTRSVTNTDPVRVNCTNIAKYNFLLNLGMEWNGGTIRCSSVNENVPSDSGTPLSDTDTLDIIEKSYCQDHLEVTVKGMPNNCHKYVVCNGNNAYGKTCNDNCFSGNNALPCTDCSTVNCGPYTTTTISRTTTTEVTTTQAPTTPAPEAYAKCSSATGYIGETVTITCTVNGTFRSINITKTANRTSTNFVNIVPSSGVINDNTGHRKSVSVLNKVITIEVTGLVCADAGTFHIQTNSDSGAHTTTASLTVNSHVTENPILKFPVKILEGETGAIKCSGGTGLPAGEIVLEINTSEGYKAIDTRVTGISKSFHSTEKDCDTDRVYTYTVPFAMALNGSEIRCTTKQENSSDHSSDSQLLLVVSNDVCSEFNKTVSAEKYHPYNCGKWVICDRGYVKMNTCGAAAPCVKITPTSLHCITTCGHCSDSHIIVPGPQN